MHRLTSSGYIEWVGCEDVVRTRTTDAVITDDRAAQLKCRLLVSIEENATHRSIWIQHHLTTMSLNDWIDQPQPIHN